MSSVIAINKNDRSWLCFSNTVLGQVIEVGDQTFLIDVYLKSSIVRFLTDCLLN